MKLPADFYPHYWQRQPCWVPSAVSLPAPGVEQLWRWARDSDHARLIYPERGFEVELEPDQPPNEGHTLLVSQIEHHWPELDAWARNQPELGRWRFADLMISHATQGASVGAHRDQYDVFLIQLAGQREWQVGTLADAALPEHNASGSRLLQGFKPSQRFVSNPGDLLYVPPGCGHHGQALSDDCMTLSVGFRQPLWSEVFEQLNLRVTDKGRVSPPGAMDNREARSLRDNLQNALNEISDADLLAAYARAMTEPTDWPDAQRVGRAMRFTPGTRAADLGEHWVVMGETVPSLGAQAFVDLHQGHLKLDPLTDAQRALLEDWAEEGWIESVDD